MAVAAPLLSPSPLVARPQRPGAALRRRRAALVAGLLAVLVWAVVTAASGPSAAAPSLATQPAAPAPTVVVVGPGDTVWDLARAHAPAGVDPAAYAAEVTARNGVDARSLPVGTVLRLHR